MARIFISYRRDDSAGHAGRLADHLGRQFGEGEIFRDVEHIAPGHDFVQAIEQAVGSCDVLIAVIGRHWLAATGADGRRRLDNPEDFVRLELATALARNIRVIPVLVQGATMPSPDDLPEELMSLARRNALELRDTSWSSDVERLIDVLRDALYAQGSLVTRPLAVEETPLLALPPSAAPASTPIVPARRAPLWRTCALIGIPIVILMCVGAGLLASNLWSGLTARVSPTTVAAIDSEDIPAVEPAPGESDDPGAGSPADALMLPVSGEVTVDEATYTVLSGSLAGAGTGERRLTLEVRMLNEGAYSRNFWADSARLLVDGVPRAPTDAPNVVVAAASAEEGAFVFTIPDTVQQVELRLGQVGQATSIIPIDLRTATGAAPAPTVAQAARANGSLVLPDEPEVTVDEAIYAVLAAERNSAGTGEVTVAFEVRMLNEGAYSRNFWADSARLLVDGVPRAPTDAPNVVVAAASAEEGTFVFTIPDTVQQVELQLGQVGQQTATISFDLQAGS